MRCKRKNFEKDSSGEVVLLVEENEDLWHLFNLICKNDRVTAKTIRKVLIEGTTGSVATKVKKTSLTLSVTKIEYDSVGNLLRISGVNDEENEYVKKGQYHTLEIEVNAQLTIQKANWDYIYRQKLKESLDITNHAQSAVILIDYGLAQIFLLTNCLAKNLFKLHVDIPKKRNIISGRQTALNRFFNQLYNAMILHINFEVIKCCLIAGPGFLKEEFLIFFFSEAAVKNVTSILKKRDIFITAKASTAYKQALNEVLSDEVVKKKMQNTSSSWQLASLEKFYDTLNATPTKACYGPKHVTFAANRDAIETLMLSDALFRSSNTATRSEYVRLTERVKKSGANVLIFSDMHVSGEQLNEITGIAAILRFPLPQLDDLNFDENFNIFEQNGNEEE